MRGVNRVMLIGNLGKDPDIQFLEGNIGVAKFSLATTETYKDRSGKLISQTEWHTVVLWRGLAELAQKYLHRGSLVYIEGRLKTRSWEDKEGNKKFATEVVGDNLIMLDKRNEGAPGGTGFDNIENMGGEELPPTDTTGGDERLPF
jgi:single-strand DNA-binding protein